jgi:hypothetical protein
MLNPAKKGRELLKAAKSKALLSNEGTASNSVEVHSVGMIIEDSQKAVESYGDDLNDEIKKLELNDEKSKLADKMNIFENKNKIEKANANTNSTFNHSLNTQNNINRPGNNILSRMNKDKEPMKIIGVQPVKNDVVKFPNNKNENKIENKNENNNDDSTHAPQKNNITENVFIPPTKNEDKEKLMKRITSAKNMNKINTQEKGLGVKKTSEKIMGMANMLQNRFTNPTQIDQEKELNKMLETEPIKNKFLLSEDNDVQQFDDEKNIDQNNPQNTHKDVINMIMEKPTKIVKKRTIKNFELKEDD